MFVPVPIKELGSEAEWSREEKLSKIAEMLKYQQQRHCFIKIDNERTQPLLVPDVQTPNVEPETLDEYCRMLYTEQGALRASDIDRLLKASEREFLERVRQSAEPIEMKGPHAPSSTDYNPDDDTDAG